ncbi:DedA family protein [Methanobacterium congolense]|uniref:Putative membrane protein YkoX n=1 Tax=Methanobacterium congolense TaxID=118062 RepID=A0A1D3L3B9_9EURY|nr:DedA family protein [Methanobacterium congolense]SCG85960.1 putative membrane protein YkoX [Methanobacterium congolense]
MFSIIEFVSSFVINLISSLGYWGVFIGMTLESACIPLPSEIIMPFSGFVVWQGSTNMTLWGITLIGALGNLFGALIAYFVGLKGGRPLLEKYGKYVLVTKSRLALADKWFDRYGYEAVLVSRVLPGIRTFISLPAGITGMDLKKFVAYTFLGSLPWCFVLGYIGVQLGPRWEIIRGYFHTLDMLVVVGLVVFIGYMIYKYAGKTSEIQKLDENEK